jgi:hypothetical protein
MHRPGPRLYFVIPSIPKSKIRVIEVSVRFGSRGAGVLIVSLRGRAARRVERRSCHGHGRGGDGSLCCVRD